MSPPDLRPFWRVLEHIKSEYLRAKEVAFSSGSESSSSSTSKPPPRQWCYEYCTARRRGADVGYVDESCLCGYEKEDLKRKADERHVKSKRSLEKRQRFREVEDPSTSDSSTDPALVEQSTLDLPTSSISPSVTAAGVTSPAQATNNGGAPPLATVTSPSTTPISTPTSEVTVITTPEASNSSGNGGLNSGAKIGLGVGLGVGIAALIALIALLCLRRRRRRSHNAPSSSSTKHLPQQQSDLSMVEATQHSQPQSRGLAEETSKPTYYNSYEIYHPPIQHAHQPLDDDAPSATMYHPPGPGQDIFQTPVSAITPTLDNNHMPQQGPRSPPTLSIPTQQDHAPSPTDHSHEGEAGPSPVSPISPVSAFSSRPPSPTPKHGGGGHG